MSVGEKALITGGWLLGAIAVVVCFLGFMALFGIAVETKRGLNAPQPAAFQCGCHYCTAPSGWFAKQCEGPNCCQPSGSG